MSQSSDDDDQVIVRITSGSADGEELNRLIANAWRDALSDSKERAEIAALLGAQEDELDQNNPPFQAEVEGAGTFGAEILIALAAGFAVGFAKEFGKTLGRAAGKRAAEVLLDLWSDHIRHRVSPPGSGRLGRDKV
jgi:hypothetical protein